MKLKWSKGFKLDEYLWVTTYSENCIGFETNNGYWNRRVSEPGFPAERSSAIQQFRSLKAFKRFIRKYGKLFPSGTEIVLESKYIGQSSPSFFKH